MEQDSEMERIVRTVLALERDYPSQAPPPAAAARNGRRAAGAPRVSPAGAAPAPGASRLAEPRAGRSRKRSSFSREQIHVLQRSFQQNPYPDFRGRGHISRSTGIPEARVQVWFQNRRARHLPRTKKPELEEPPQEPLVLAGGQEEEEEDELEGHLFFKGRVSWPQGPTGPERPPWSLASPQPHIQAEVGPPRSCWPILVHFRSPLTF
ncbi:homeobox protein MIXL1-like [Rhinatrema bivittatum]|uniref:homeobox protein MIXL1-like n=1 Tax=Rhinatrema bivittatum TaxID=194408 RepID=UPI00112B2811|nr:homeobox protein MIXL1-like [Rhinatrema bivittatum]